jgi:hypothetical protein
LKAQTEDASRESAELSRQILELLLLYFLIAGSKNYEAYLRKRYRWPMITPLPKSCLPLFSLTPSKAMELDVAISKNRKLLCVLVSEH